MRRILVRGAQAIEVLRWPEDHLADVFMEFRDPFASLDFLRHFLDDPVSLMTLREVLAEESGYTDITGLDDQEVLEGLAWRLVWGQVKIAPSVISRPAVQLGVAGPAIAEEEEEAVAPAATAVRQTGVRWIKFRVVDDATDRPVAGVGLKVKLPDGTIKEYTTDSNGIVHITDLPPGTCDIQEVLDADALEIVRVS